MPCESSIYLPRYLPFPHGLASNDVGTGISLIPSMERCLGRPLTRAEGRRILLAEELMESDKEAAAPGESACRQRCGMTGCPSRGIQEPRPGEF